MTPPKVKGDTKAAAPALTVEAVTPPPRVGRKGSVAFPKETIDALAEFIKDGALAGDGQEYATKQQANTRVTRLKRALIHYGHYTEPKQIKSRTWETENGKFRLAVTNAAATPSE
jgi:hypothetical protein